MDYAWRMDLLALLKPPTAGGARASNGPEAATMMNQGMTSATSMAVGSPHSSPTGSPSSSTVGGTSSRSSLAGCSSDSSCAGRAAGSSSRVYPATTTRATSSSSAAASRTNSRAVHQIMARARRLDERGRHNEALPLHQRALKLLTARLGEEHPDTIDCMSRLASCLLTLGDSEAQRTCQRALDLSRAVLGEGHELTGRAVAQLGRCLEALTQSILAQEHARRWDSINEHALELCRLGDLEGAEPLFRRSVEEGRCMYGPTHPDTLISMINLGHCLHLMCHCEEAEEVLRPALSGAERVWGCDHPDTRICRELVERCMDDSEDWD